MGDAVGQGRENMGLSSDNRNGESREETGLEDGRKD